MEVSVPGKPKSLWAARECARAGAYIYLGGALVLAGLWFAFLFLSFPDHFRVIFQRSKTVFHIARTLYTAVPLAMFIGAAAGWNSHRRWMQGLEAALPGVLQAGRKPSAWLAIVLAVLLGIVFVDTLTVGTARPVWPGLFVLFVMVELQRFYRWQLDTCIKENKRSTGKLTLVYFLLYAGLSFTIGYCLVASAWVADNPNSNAVVMPLAAVLTASLGISDCALAWTFSELADQNRLAAPAGRFQFSLAALMAILLSMGTWVSGLVLFYR